MSPKKIKTCKSNRCTGLCGVNWTATDTVLTIRLYDDGDHVDTIIVSYEVDKSGESWVLNITDEEVDMFSLIKIN